MASSLRTGDGERLTREKFRALLGRTWFLAVLVLVPCAAMVGFAYAGNAPFAIGAPIALAIAILLIGRGWAAGEAREQVLQGFAAAHGFALDEDPATPGWTPLLRAGDEREMDVAMTGSFEGAPVLIGHYTYTDVTHTTDKDGQSRTERTDHDFTIASTDVTAAAAALPTFYLKPDRGLFDIGDGWLQTGGMTRCETESVRFNERYKGWHRSEQDLMILRRFLDPSTVDALANHPLRFGVEVSGGCLLVYIPDHCADSGELGGLLDALAMVRRCLLAAARVSEPA